MNSSSFFGAFPFFDTFNPQDLHPFNLLSQNTMQDSNNPYPQALNWNNYLNTHISLTDKKTTEEMPNNSYFEKDGNGSIRENPPKNNVKQTKRKKEDKSSGNGVKLEEESKENEILKKKERRQKKAEKARNKTNFKNTYINKINMLICERNESKKRSKKEQNEKNEKNSSKKSSNNSIKDPFQRIKSYDVNPEFSQGDQKLLRNRESARNSRKRKKMYIELLENKVSELSSELLEMKSLVFENQKNIDGLSVQNDLKDSNINKKQVLDFLEGAIQNKQNFNHIQSYLETISLKNETIAKQRRSSVSFFFDQILDIMLPVHIRYLLWTAFKNQDIFDPKPENFEKDLNSKKEKLTAWSRVLMSLGMNDKEKEEIVLNKKKLLDEKIFFERIARALHNLKALLGNEILNFESNIYSELQNILTSEQYAKIFLFMEKQEDFTPNQINKFDSEKDESQAKELQKTENNEIYLFLEKGYDMLKSNKAMEGSIFQKKI